MNSLLQKSQNLTKSRTKSAFPITLWDDIRVNLKLKVFNTLLESNESSLLVKGVKELQFSVPEFSAE